LKVLLIHTYYKEKGGEDVAFELQLNTLKQAGVNTETLIFYNSRNTIFNLLFQLFNPFSYYTVLKKIKYFKPDIVHVHNFHFAGSPSVIWAAKKSKTSIVVTLHNFRLLCPSGILYHSEKLFLKSLNGKFPWQAVQKKVYKDSYLLTFWLALTIKTHHWIGTWKKVDRFFALTEFSKEIYLKSCLRLTDNQITVQPNYIESRPKYGPITKGGFVYVGRLSNEKGIEVILNAFKIFPFNLIVIGDGPLRNQVEQFTKSNPKIKYLGFQEKEVVQDIMGKSSALLFASKCYESMPMTILESFACSTPVIASELGGIPSIVKDDYNGLLFENCNPHDLAKKIEYWINLDPIKKEEFYTNSYITFKTKFRTDVRIQETISIYRNLKQ
jgi:glycosyltransferase involved in cell wall biosynthesis